MIRQAINCDMCGVEKVEAASFWFVAEEQGSELRLRGWDVSKRPRKDQKHLCGQKCVQRLMDNFTAAIKAGHHAGKSAKEVATLPAVASIERTATLDCAAATSIDREDMPILERMGYDSETAAMIEAESWAGPVKPKEESLRAEPKPVEEKGFIRAARVKPVAARVFRRMA